MLRDLLGRTPAEGFAAQLALIADELDIEGGVSGGAGCFRVWGGRAHHVATVHLEGAGPVLRVFSNVKFPPGELPRGVAAALVRWRAANACFIWDAHSCEDWSCAVMRCGIAPASFTAQVLASVMEGVLAEVNSLDRLLAEHGLGRAERVPPFRGARPAVGPAQAEGQRRLEGPRPAQSIVRRVTDAASRLLGGW